MQLHDFIHIHYMPSARTAMRQPYLEDRVALLESDLPTKDPVKLFEIWFQKAKECKEIYEVNAVCLATANKCELFSCELFSCELFSCELSFYELLRTFLFSAPPQTKTRQTSPRLLTHCSFRVVHF